MKLHLLFLGVVAGAALAFVKHQMAPSRGTA